MNSIRDCNYQKIRHLSPWLDVLALLAWGILLLKYTLTGQFRLLIHPNYFGLVLATSIILLLLAIFKIISLWRSQGEPILTEEHITLFPPGVSSSILLLAAIAGLIIPPKVLASQTAMQRGVVDIPLTRSTPQTFRASVKPEARTLIDWIRTLNAYPEPDAYTGQPANISGFVLHLSELPDNYLLLSRFVLTCCAVDAYPISIPVQLPDSKHNYPVDTWLQIKGKMITVTLPSHNQSLSNTAINKRQLVLKAETITAIPTPRNPYNYNF